MDSGGMDRKKKMDGEDLPNPKRHLLNGRAGDEENDMLTLSLSSSFHNSSVQHHQPASLPSPPPRRFLEFSLPEGVPSPSHRLYDINQETGTLPASVHPAPPPPPHPPLLLPSSPFLAVTLPELTLSPRQCLYNNQETGTSSTSVHAAQPSRPRAGRRNPSRAPREGKKTDPIPQAFPWSTTIRATVQSLSCLRSKQINSISGDVQCKKCDRQLKMEFNLDQKFAEIKSYIELSKTAMCDRAPRRWMHPNLPNCDSCGNQNCIHPAIPDKKKSINWLFLLLGEMLGLLTLNQLKYFCKYTDNHRTGAKDRVLYLTYLGLCKQLDPNENLFTVYDPYKSMG